MTRLGWKEWSMVAVALLAVAVWMNLPQFQQEEPPAPAPAAVTPAPVVALAEPVPAEEPPLYEAEDREDDEDEAAEERLDFRPGATELKLADGRHEVVLFYPEPHEAVAFLDIYRDGRRVYRESYNGAHGGRLLAADCTRDGQPDVVVIVEGRRTSQVLVIQTDPRGLPSRRLHRHEVVQLAGEPGPEGLTLVTADGTERSRWDGYRFKTVALR